MESDAREEKSVADAALQGAVSTGALQILPLPLPFPPLPLPLLIVLQRNWIPAASPHVTEQGDQSLHSPIIQSGPAVTVGEGVVGETSMTAAVGAGAVSPPPILWNPLVQHRVNLLTELIVKTYHRVEIACVVRFEPAARTHELGPYLKVTV